MGCEQRLEATPRSIGLLEAKTWLLSEAGRDPGHKRVVMTETKVARDARNNK
jgi:hypothetical protein